MVPIGERGQKESLEIAERDEQISKDERSRAAWGDLASYVLGKGTVQLKDKDTKNNRAEV